MKGCLVWLLLFFVSGLFALMALGIASGYSSESETRDIRANWTVVPGTVIDSKVSINGQDKHPNWNMYVWFAERPHWDITVRFAYAVGGVPYSTEQRWYTVSNDETPAKAEARDYPPGAKVPVHYNPANPEKAAIKPMKRTIKEADYEFNAVLIASLLGFLGPVFLIWRQPIVTRTKVVWKAVEKWRQGVGKR
ncbi:MAG: DUF3592 domain-containing protein [Chloroflexi bacterium]|nr:DUF3592 domain-containing protein [Chloroflexota bacterium]